MINLDYQRNSSGESELYLRSAESHTPKDSLLVNHESLPYRILMFLIIGLRSRRKALDIDHIPINLLAVMLQRSRHLKSKSKHNG